MYESRNSDSLIILSDATGSNRHPVVGLLLVRVAVAVPPLLRRPRRPAPCVGAVDPLDVSGVSAVFTRLSGVNLKWFRAGKKIFLCLFWASSLLGTFDW